MNIKKLLSVLMICIMIVSGVTTMAFAEEVGLEAYPNFCGSVWTDNHNCVHKADSNVSIKISKEGMSDVIVTIPYDADIEEYYIETVTEGMDDILREVAPVYDSEILANGIDAVDGLAIMESLGYSVEVIAEDNDDSHEFSVDSESLYVEILTYNSVKVVLDLVVTMLEEAIMEYDPTYVPTGSFDALLEIYKEMLLDPEGGDLTEEEAEEALAEIMAYEDLMAKLESGEYAGELTVYCALECECVELAEYTLYHEYYDENDEYVAQETEWPLVPNGSVVTTEQLKEMYVTEYEGKKYEVEGVYLVDNETGEVDWDNPVEEFTVIDGYDEETETWYWTEVVIKYVPAADDTGDNAGGEGNGDQNNSNTDDKNDSKVESGVPPTGDNTSIGFFVLLMAVAVVGLKKIKA